MASGDVIFPPTSGSFADLYGSFDVYSTYLYYLQDILIRGLYNGHVIFKDVLEIDSKERFICLDCNITIVRTLYTRRSLWEGDLDMWLSICPECPGSDKHGTERMA